MKTDLVEIQRTLKNIMRSQVPPLKVSKNSDQVFELIGSKEAMQGKQKVKGYYFGSVVPKPKDIRLYFFPIYTHPQAYAAISEETRKCLKGKSCFHIKKMSEEMESEIADMVKTGVQIYLTENLI